LRLSLAGLEAVRAVDFFRARGVFFISVFFHVQKLKIWTRMLED
jgi:hypothetical protein